MGTAVSTSRSQERSPRSVNVGFTPVPPESRTPNPDLAPHDLAEIMGAFGEATDRLQSAHLALQAEVRRLNTELRETNEQLRRSRQLAALGQMAAGIAHEVRNPLGSIRLYASMLADDLADRPASRSVAMRIAQAVGDLDAVVGDVLNFARELRVRRQPVSASVLFDQALESCHGLLHGAPIEVRRGDRRAGSSSSPVLAVDPGLMNQALVNVIRNAVEAMEGAGTLAFDVRGVEIDDRQAASGDDGEVAIGVSLIVRDTGPGIDAAVLDRIFNPFFTTRHTGTGLGLAIVHRIVDAHGGSIRIANNVDRGATVELILPGPSGGLKSAGLGSNSDSGEHP